MVIIVAAHRTIEASRSWSEGFEDHARLMQLYEMSPDDDALLAELRTALKSHIKTAGLYRKGDSGRIDKAADWSDFKNLAWEMTVLRREKGK
jgi:hypothetical protein